MIGIIDYGLSNLPNVEKAVRFAGAESIIIDSAAQLGQADKLILPGVGAFGAGMAGLAERRLVDPLKRAVNNGTPLLGICLGMQLLFANSEEAPTVAGLNLLPGTVRRFAENELPVPHMGWNQLNAAQTHPLLSGCEDGSYLYFVHSYYCDPSQADHRLATTNYGIPFTCIAGNAHIFGMQFHPEKSQAAGLQLLRNFINL